ncbi:MAG: DUF222 domain-containing protein [Wenzhouxiangella sp.]
MTHSAPATTTLPGPKLRELEDQITELAAHIHAADYRFLCLVREFDTAGGWTGPGLHSCAHWLNWKCGIGLNAAREKVRVAHALAELPHISSSFAGGRISYSKVRAMTRVASPNNEQFLLRIALNGTASHVERAVRLYRRAKRAEALAHENRRHQQRKVTWRHDEDGSMVLHARFTPEQGERIRLAIEAAMEEIEAEQENLTAETSGEPDLDHPIPCAHEQRRADALERLADHFLNGSDSGTTHGGERCTLHVHTDIDTLKESGQGAESSLENPGNVSAETSRRLACDCSVVHWLEDEDGNTLNIGRKSRTIPPAIRRALKHRDKGCRFPGCNAHKHTDAHHIQHWADGGETKLENLVTLCRHHHRAVHEGGFTVKMNAHGQPEFRDPNGKILPSSPETRYRGNAFALITENRSKGLDLTAETCVPDWGGEGMDGDIVVGVLYELEGRPSKAQSASHPAQFEKPQE